MVDFQDDKVVSKYEVMDSKCEFINSDSQVIYSNYEMADPKL